jgi:Response regulator containing CheY-like receiver, AAA-type ATPase, and DNA-binding domains
LFYRLNVIAIEIPPLRQRPEDILLLAESFLQQIARARGEEPKTLSAEAAEQLRAYSWPGNVRELENAVERAVILSPTGLITPASLPDRIRQRKSEPLISERAAENPSLDAIERAYIMWVLGSEGGNKSKAAETLGIDPSTLHRKLFKFGVELV